MAGFSVARFALGLAEGGNFPGAIKTVGLWHPKSERALSTGIFNSGSNVGIIVAAYAVPFVVERDAVGLGGRLLPDRRVGLRVAGVLAGDVRRARTAPAGFAGGTGPHPQRSARPARPHLLAQPACDTARPGPTRWACSWSVPVWWFYLYWMPKFLKNNHGIDLGHVFWPLLVVYLMADVGSIGGGGLSSWLIRRGATVNVARKTAFLACALCVVPVVSRRAGDQHVGGGVAGRAGRRRARRLLRQSLHDRLRHGPAQGGQLGRRHRRHGRLRGHARSVHADRLHSRLDRSASTAKRTT